MMKRLSPDASQRLFLGRLLALVVVCGFILFLVRIGDLLILVFGSTLGAVLLTAVADAIARWTGWRRGIAVGVATLLLFMFFGAIGWLFGAETATQASKLWQTLPGDWERLRLAIEANPIGKLFSASFRQGSQGSRLAHLLLGAGWGASEIIGNFLIVLIGVDRRGKGTPLAG